MSRSVSMIFRSKFGKDVSWNFASFIILGITGIVLNILVGRFYGAGVLGVFNQVFALYIFFSQFAVFGIHFSVLKHVAEFAEDRRKCNAIITSAIAITAICTTIICLIAYMMVNWIGEVLESPDVGKGILFILPGLFCFALNKVFFSILNGLRHMKAFALVQAIRYLMMLIILVGCIVFRAPGVVLPAIISGAEVIIFLILIIYTLKFYTPVGVGMWSGWERRHINFGTRSFLSGTMAELNTRVDVLMLGYFSSDSVVGIYSIAALIVEGLAQISVVVRNNLNPLLTELITQHRTDELRQTVSRGIKLFYLAMGLIGIAAVIMYPYFIRLLVANKDFIASWAPFGILMSGIIISSGYLPFNMIMVQAGYPGLHTFYVAAIIFSNVLLNGLLIPFYGMYGAAYATAASYILSVFYLKFLVRKTISIQI